jgi:hypothetical protein
VCEAGSGDRCQARRRPSPGGHAAVRHPLLTFRF